MTGPRSTDSFREGLQLQQLMPPDIVAFFQGLPRRVSNLFEDADRDDVDGEARRRASEHVVEMADHIGRFVDRVVDAGFPLDPEVETAHATAGGVAVRRLEAGVTEAARRLAALSAADWQSSPGLLDDARNTVADLAQALRRVASLLAGN